MRRVRWLAFILVSWAMCIAGGNASAVGRWIDQRPQARADVFLGVCFIDESHGWAVGHPQVYPVPANAIIVHTTDGGDNWTRQESGVAYQLHGVHFVTADSGWAVGQNGTVLNTTDGGETWAAEPFGEFFGLDDVFFTDRQHGWIIGFPTAIFGTDDGGENWDQQSVPPGVPPDCFLTDVFFVDSLQGWVVGYVPPIVSPIPEDGVILRTVDGGQTWQDRTFLDCPPLYGVHFPNDSLGWAAGAYATMPRGAVLYTDDGGDSWTVDGGVLSGPLIDVHFADVLHGWVLGSEEGVGNPVILETQDGGTIWDPQSVETAELLLSFCFVGEKAWGVGEHGLIVRLDPDEDTWRPLETWGSYSIRDMDFVGPETGWACGYKGLLLHTTDAGANWDYQWCGQTDMLVIEGVDFADSLAGWVVGLGGTVGREGLIMHTQDAGVSWELQDSVDVSLREVCFVNSLNGWTVGDNFLTGQKKIYRTSNGGQDWDLIYQDSNGGFLWDVFFLDPQNGWVVADDSLWVTTDGGDNWSTELREEGLQQLDFVDLWTGWVVGSHYGPKIFHRSMFEDWSAQTAPTDQGLFGVDFVDVNSGWAVGNGGAIVRTSNGGQEWIAENSNTLKFLRCVSFPDALHGWAAGYGGTLLRYLASGDFDGDGDVDVDDYAQFDACFTGEGGGPIDPGCEAGEFDNDGDIDCNDWDQFVASWLDPQPPPELPQCPRSAVEEGTLPKLFALHQNVPNPFNPHTVMRFSIPEPGPTRLAIFNVAGQRVRTLLDEFREGGNHTVVWDGKNDGGSELASGVYLCRLGYRGQHLTRKVVLLR